MPKAVKEFIMALLFVVVLIPLVLLGTCSAGGGVAMVFAGFSARGGFSMIREILIGAILLLMGFVFFKLSVWIKIKCDAFIKKGDIDADK